MTIFDINSPETLRRFLYGFIPGLGAILVGAGIVTDTQATQWIGLALALLSPALAAVKTASGFRTWLYPVVAAVGAVVTGYGIVAGDTWQLWTSLIPLVLGGVAAGNTHTDTLRAG